MPEEPMPRRRGRRPARTREQLREDTVQTGMRLLAEHGLSIGLDTVRLDDVIQAAGVPRASTYRAWTDPSGAHGPQSRFHEALITRLLESQDNSTSPLNGLEHTEDATITAARKVFAEMPQPTSDLTADERRYWLRQAIRAAGNANQEAKNQARLWHCSLAISSGLLTSASDQTLSQLSEAWRRGESSAVARYEQLYEAVVDLFHLRLNPGYTWQQFDTAAAALADGLIIRQQIAPETQHVVLPTGPNEEPQDWSLYAIGLDALFAQFFNMPEEP